MGYLLLGSVIGAWLLAATVVVVRRAERGDHHWGVARARVALPAAGAYRSSVVVRWRALRAPRAAVLAAWTAMLVGVACVPAALVAILFAVVALSFDVAGLASGVLLCAAPIASFRAFFGARTALGLLDGDLVQVARARTEARWEQLFDVLFIVAMFVAIAVAGRADGFALAGVAWACVGLGQSLLLGHAASAARARLVHLTLPPADDAMSPPVPG